jgi:CopG family nickel-responsive transcriptional regulator
MRTSVNVPENVLAEFDAVWQAEGLASRSRAIREAMQEYVESHSRLEATAGEIAAVVAFDYQHDPVIRDLHTVQHEFQDVITTTSHVHQGDWCLETVFCRGSAGRVRRLVYRLRDFDAVARVSVLSLSTDTGQEHHAEDQHGTADDPEAAEESEPTGDPATTDESEPTGDPATTDDHDPGSTE